MLTTTLSVLALATIGAANDNNVEWDGVSHVAWQDRRPLCPLDGESFDVVFQTYQFDITSARVFVDDGAGVWVDASFDHDRGPYAVWRATISATESADLSYYIEFTDGTDVDYFSVGGMSEDVPVDGGFVVDFDTLSHAPIGATPHPDGGTVFKVWAPAPATASVRGEFNGWGLANPMAKTGEHFTTFAPTADVGDMYKFYFNSTDTWKPDARAKAFNPPDNYNAFIEDPFSYTWSDADFETPPFEEMVIYELHVGTFAGRNDPIASGAIPATYLDVAAHVDHFVELGINAVELLPITEYPWDFSAGYNPITAYAAEWKHGTPDDLKHLIDVFHQNGIAVIHDIVWNHFSGSDNYLWNYTNDSGGSTHQIYFDGTGGSCTVDTPWGCQADFDRLDVRDYFVDSALFWLEEMHLDGFRMDATDFMDPYQSTGWGLMQRFNDTIDNRWVDKISIAEQLPDDSFVTRPTDLGGAGFDAQWYDAFTDQLRQEIFDAAFGDPEMWRIRNIINGGGTFLSGADVVNYLESHDEAWPESGGQRMVITIDPSAPHDDIYAKGRTKLGNGIVMTAPGIPMILQGTEWLEDTNFGGGSPGGADRLDWSKRATYANIFNYYKDIIAIRRANCGMRADAPRNVFHVDEANNVIGFSRGEGQEIVVVANFTNNNYDTDYVVNFPMGGQWFEIMNSQAAEYDGNGMGNAGLVVADEAEPHAATVVVPQMSLLVFRHENPNGRSTDTNSDGATDLKDFATVQNVIGRNGCGLVADFDENARVNLVDHATLVDGLTGPTQ